MASNRTPQQRFQVLKVVMVILVSVVLLAASLYIILSGMYPVAVQTWASTVVVAVMTFWLKVKI